MLHVESCCTSKNISGNICAQNGYCMSFIKHQPHESELTGKIVNELPVKLIRGEQATFSCLFMTCEDPNEIVQRLQR